MVISVAEYAGYQVFDPTSETGGLEGKEDLEKFTDIAKKAILFMQYLVGGLALIAGVRSGYALIMGGDDDEVQQKEKEFVKIFLFAIGLILFAEAIAHWIDIEDGASVSIDSGAISREIIGLINYALTFLSAAALFMVVLSSLYYVISFGNDETTGRAKKMIIASVVGLLLAYSSYTIVRFLF